MKFRPLCVLVLSLATAIAAAEEAVHIEEIVVYGRAQQQIGMTHAASEGQVGYDDIALPPLLRVGELVEAVPGMVATQHSGTGKANQYFLRGFNLDHGTDFSAHLEGMPINMRTHGHGQGYLDLNFMIPELVKTTHYRKGPYYAQVGDFSSAGSVEFSLYEALPESTLLLTLGEHNYGRGLIAGSADLGGGVLTGALTATTYEGAWEEPEDLSQYKLYLAYAFDLGDSRARLSFSGYDGEWNATDQIPQRAVEEGLISRYGAIDPTLGGQTERFSVTAGFEFANWDLTAYVIDYDFTLYGNFTYLLERPDSGDQVEQRDNRTIWGGRADGEVERELAGRPVIYRWGGDFRYDDIAEVGLYATTARIRNEILRDDKVQILSLGGYTEAEIQITDRFRSVFGLRGDYFDWDVDALVDENGGEGNEGLIAPKVTLSYRLTSQFEGYANWGRGFHSNDVRGATTTLAPDGSPSEPTNMISESTGGELGIRFEKGTDFNATLVGFSLELDSELIYVGDSAATEANDGTRREGIELTAFWQANNWLALHSEYTYTDARFKTDQGGGRKIPGAVESTFVVGANAQWDNRWSASARLRYLSSAPLLEDNSVRSDDSLIINFGLGYEIGLFGFRVDIFNLLDSNENDISYFYASRLPDEPAEGVEDIHFHPLEPRTVRATVSLRW